MIDISIICCYNKQTLFDNTLITSLKTQKYKNYEIIGIDNSNRKYKSAAAALNCGINASTGKYIIVVHQDFEFKDCDALLKIKNYLEHNSELDVLGVAGAKLDKDASILRKIVGRNRVIYASLIDSNNLIDAQMEVETVDECCFFFRRTFWETYHFDEQTCNGWDLYAVDMCLKARMLGGRAFVVPISSLHLSGGTLTKSFYVVLKKMAIKYQRDFERIITPCVVTTTKFPEIEYIKLLLINRIRIGKIRKRK